MRSLRVRSALTLLELIVALAIVGVLAGLLLPAVQAVRAASHRTSCSNNLRQIGLAVHGYHDCNLAMPTGCSDKGADEPHPHMSWLTRLLPYAEQSALWDSALAAFAQDRFFESLPHAAILSKPVRLFLCPAESRGGAPFDFGNFSAAFTHYLGVEGNDFNRHDGVLFLNSAVRIGDIADGMANTLLAGERPPSADHTFGWWYAGWGQNKTGSAEYLLGVRERRVYPRARYRPCIDGPYHFAPGSLTDPCSAFQFWSAHPGGGHFLFCDGSVRFLAYSADAVLPALATRAGGEVP